MILYSVHYRVITADGSIMLLPLAQILLRFPFTDIIDLLFSQSAFTNQDEAGVV